MLPSWRGVILPAQQAQQDRRLLHIQLEGQLQQAAAAFLALDRSFAGLKREWSVRVTRLLVQACTQWSQHSASHTERCTKRA